MLSFKLQSFSRALEIGFWIPGGMWTPG